MLRTSTITLGLLLSILSVGQDKLKELTLKDALTKSFSELAPERLNALQWVKGTDTYSFVKDNVLTRGGTGRMADLPIVSLEKLNEQMPKDAGLKGFPAITWESTEVFTFEQGGREFTYNVGNSRLEERMTLDPEGERNDNENSAHNLAYTLGEDLWVRKPGTAAAIRVTSDGTDGIVSGRSVHREEYGITKGTFWNPDGSRLAFYRMDERQVSPYWLEDINTKPSHFKKIRYPMAGDTSHQVTVGVFDLASNRTTFLKTTGAPDDYLTNISWDPEGRHVFVIHLNRATDKLRVVQYDAATGNAVRTLIEEEDKKWLEPQHPLIFLNGTPSRYIYWSQRDGWWHLYLYDLKSGLVRGLTPGDWVVQRIIGTDEKGTNLFVEGTAIIDAKDPKGAMETHLYRIDLGNGRATRLTSTAGTHHGQLSSNGRFLIDTWSSATVPGRTEILDAAKGTVLKTLVNSKDPMAAYAVGTIELISLPGENGDLLNARLIKPRGFDSRRKYPVIVYTYNGPHVQLVTNSFLGGASPWMLHAAERGYLVFTVDGHGSENRGRTFEQAIYRQLGVVEVKDQLRGVDHLKSLPYVDAERMAIHGWSFGGHMTVALMLRSPETFKVGVAGGPVMDWAMYEVMYTERYMDTPAENPEGYALTRHTDKAVSLRGDLLLIHGVQDEVVLPEHSLSFLKNCIDNGVQAGFFPYPGHAHNVRGKDRLHLYTKILDHIDARIGPGR